VVVFDGPELANHLVELGIGNLGVVVPEITIVVECDQLP
jgi:hypothetical protein